MQGIKIFCEVRYCSQLRADCTVRSGLASYFGDPKQSQRETIAVRSVSEPANKTSGNNEQKQNQIAMQAKIDSLESAVRELTALYKSRAQGPNRPQGVVLDQVMDQGGSEIDSVSRM